jgi:hypothetical protein
VLPAWDGSKTALAGSKILLRPDKIGRLRPCIAYTKPALAEPVPHKATQQPCTTAHHKCSDTCSPTLRRTVSDNITVRKMVTRFVTSPPTDNCPQPKEALPTVSQL